MTKYKLEEDKVKALNSDVVLVAVSKNHTYDSVMEAYEEGARVFGENRVQEAMHKFADKKSDMKIYLIGQLQSNKVRKAVAFFDRIESVDSIALLEKINKEAERIGKIQDILFEFNSSEEENKSGFRTESEVAEAFSLSSSLKNVRALGIMTVGPLGGDREKNRKAFLRTRALFDEMRDEYPISVLSMGMSGDFEEAIECGSTEVRIGTAIFGERDYTCVV